MIERREQIAVAETAVTPELLLRSIGEGLIAVDCEGTITLVNPAAAEMLGYETEAMLGRNAHALVHHSHRDGSAYPVSECPITHDFGRRASGEGEFFWRKDGTSFEIGYTTTPVLDGEEHVGAVVVFRDVTRRRQLEEQLRHAQKLEAVGRLAGGIAHDFNNLLTAILGYSDLALQLVGGERGAREIEQVKLAGLRARDLTAKLLAFGRRQELSPQTISVNEQIGEALPLLSRLIGDDVEIETRLAADVGPCHADPGSLHQAIVNLFVNARDAMPDGGRISVETRNERVECPAAERLGIAEGDYVAVAVADTGSGMDAETLERIFDPFFTTKPVGEGTGLGLPMVYGFVNQSGGAVGVKSAPGRGSTFTLYLPRVAS